MTDLSDYTPPLKQGYLALPDHITLSGGSVIIGDPAGGGKGTTIAFHQPFIATVSVGSITVASGSGVNVITDALVGTIGRKAYVTGVILNNTGASWGSAGFYLQDTTGKNLLGFIPTVSASPAIPLNSALQFFSSGSITLYNTIRDMTGGTANKGLYFVSDGTTIVNASGGTATLTVYGYIK